MVALPVHWPPNGPGGFRLQSDERTPNLSTRMTLTGTELPRKPLTLGRRWEFCLHLSPGRGVHMLDPGQTGGTIRRGRHAFGSYYHASVYAQDYSETFPANRSGSGPPGLRSGLGRPAFARAHGPDWRLSLHPSNRHAWRSGTGNRRSYPDAEQQTPNHEQPGGRTTAPEGPGESASISIRETTRSP